MRKKILFFYPHLANDFPDVPSAGDTGTGTNYIYINNIETNVSNKRVKKGQLTKLYRTMYKPKEIK